MYLIRAYYSHGGSELWDATDTRRAAIAAARRALKSEVVVEVTVEGPNDAPGCWDDDLTFHAVKRDDGTIAVTPRRT